MSTSRPTLVLSLQIEEPPRLVVVADHEADELRLAAHVDSLLERRRGVLEATIARWLVELEERAA